MSRSYKFHPKSKDCPICGGALYKGKPCEACGFCWTAWKGGNGENAILQPAVSSDEPDEKKEKETSSWRT